MDWRDSHAPPRSTSGILFSDFAESDTSDWYLMWSRRWPLPKDDRTTYRYVCGEWQVSAALTVPIYRKQSYLNDRKEYPQRPHDADVCPWEDIAEGISLAIGSGYGVLVEVIDALVLRLSVARGRDGDPGGGNTERGYGDEEMECNVAAVEDRPFLHMACKQGMEQIGTGHT